MNDPAIHDDGSVVGALLTIAVDDELNVVFLQDFDADFGKIENAMRKVASRIVQQIVERGKCPFAPVDIPKLRRFHLLDDVTFQTSDGPFTAGKGWLLISEDEYATLTFGRIK